MKLTDIQKFKVLQLSSGHMLTEKYPANWEELEYAEQQLFIEENAWLAISFDQSAADIIEITDDISNCTIAFIENEL